MVPWWGQKNSIAAYLKDDVTQILLVTIQWLQQLQPLLVQYEHGVAFGEDQLEGDLCAGIAIDGQLWRIRSLEDGCGVFNVEQDMIRCDHGLINGDTYNSPGSPPCP